jgi:MHS family proline/betaine transporter-like MFS transporter
VLVGAFCAVNPTIICEIFPAGVRASAASTAYNFTMAALGGTAPLVAIWLIDRTGHPLAVAFYVILASAISTVATLSVRAQALRRIDEAPGLHSSLPR